MVCSSGMCFSFEQDKKTNPAYGADVLRLWVAQSGTDPRVHIGPNLLSACNERLFKVV